MRRVAIAITLIVLIAGVVAGLTLSQNPPRSRLSSGPDGAGTAAPKPVAPAQTVASMLNSAAVAGNVGEIKRLIARGADLNALDDQYGFAPLHHAANANKPEAVRALLEAGADVNVVTPQDMTPLHIAAHFGFADVARLLIEGGADVDAIGTSGGIAPLHAASAAGHMEIVKLLLNAGAIIPIKSADGAAPIRMAEEQGFNDIVHLLAAEYQRRHANDQASPSPRN